MGRMQLVTIIVSNSKCYLSDDGLIDPTCFRYIEYVSYYCIIFYIFLCNQNKVFFELIVLFSTKKPIVSNHVKLKFDHEISTQKSIEQLLRGGGH